MADRVDLNVHPYGLGGGTYLSGSVTIECDGFMYYPLTASSANIVMAGSIVSGSSVSSSAWTAGIPIYGPITQVTQSSGIAFVYNGITSNRYTF